MFGIFLIASASSFQLAHCWCSEQHFPFAPRGMIEWSLCERFFLTFCKQIHPVKSHIGGKWKCQTNFLSLWLLPWLFWASERAWLECVGTIDLTATTTTKLLLIFEVEKWHSWRPWMLVLTRLLIIRNSICKHFYEFDLLNTEGKQSSLS